VLAGSCGEVLADGRAHWTCAVRVHLWLLRLGLSLPRHDEMGAEAPMSLFRHKPLTGRSCLRRFQAEHGDGFVELSFETRDGLPHEITVLRSETAFAQESVDPSGDSSQTLVYRGRELHARVRDENLRDGVTYYYSVFAYGSDGFWHLQTKTIVVPGEPARRQWPWGNRELNHERYEFVRCDVCEGTGLNCVRAGSVTLRLETRTVSPPCWKCHGKGWLKVERA
jgi:hypothetical protein